MKFPDFSPISPGAGVIGDGLIVNVVGLVAGRSVADVEVNQIKVYLNAHPGEYVDDSKTICLKMTDKGPLLYAWIDDLGNNVIVEDWGQGSALKIYHGFGGEYEILCIVSRIFSKSLKLIDANVSNFVKSFIRESGNE